MKTTRLRVTLSYVDPPVVRVVDLPAAATLEEVHLLLQAALGWTDSHLHQFVAGDATYGRPHPDDWTEVRDEALARLRDLPERFTYLYDFGDGWEHEVDVLGPGDDSPGCRYGEGACPPEDCGGPSGYEELLAVLADPTHADHEHMRGWAGELAEFDPVAADALVRAAVGEVPASVRLVLELAAGGVKLTPAGRLPRVFVRAVQEHRPQWAWSGRLAATEDDLPPLCALHDILRAVGLLRLSKGTLAPTKAARDDLQIVRRLRRWFTPGEFTTLLAEAAAAALAATGPRRVQDLAGEIHVLLGSGWSRGASPVTVRDVELSLHRLSAELRALDLIDTTDSGAWSPGPAGALLRRLTW